MTKSIAISKVKVDGGTQTRAGTNGPVVYEYADLMRVGVKFPPIVVYHDGEEYWLADGFHRVAAAKEVRLSNIMADIHQGTRRDAVLHSVGANTDHGLRRTNDDKRRAVEMLLRDEEWAKWSNREIARRCAVSDVMVGNIRENLKATANHLQSNERIGADGRTTNTANIGKKPAPDIVRGNNQPPITPVTRTLPTQPDSPVIADERINNLHTLKPGDTVRTPDDGMGKVVSLRWSQDPHEPATYAVRLTNGGRLQRYKHEQLTFVPTPPPARPVTRTTSYEDGYVPDVPEVEIDGRPAGMVYTLPLNSAGTTPVTSVARVKVPYPTQALLKLKLYHTALTAEFSADDVAAVRDWLAAVEASQFMPVTS